MNLAQQEQELFDTLLTHGNKLTWKETSWGTLETKTEHYQAFLSQQGSLTVYERRFWSNSYRLLFRIREDGDTDLREMYERIRGTQRHMRTLDVEITREAKEFEG